MNNKTIKKIGSASIEKLKDTDYKVRGQKNNCFTLEDKTNGKKELWFGHKTPISGYQIKYKKLYLEFLSSCIN